MYVKSIPKEWDLNEVKARFAIVGQIDDVHQVRDDLGKRSQQVIITYKSEDSATQAVAKFNDRLVDGLICKIKPYFDRHD